MESEDERRDSLCARGPCPLANWPNRASFSVSRPDFRRPLRQVQPGVRRLGCCYLLLLLDRPRNRTPKSASRIVNHTTLVPPIISILLRTAPAPSATTTALDPTPRCAPARPCPARRFHSQTRDLLLSLLFSLARPGALSPPISPPAAYTEAPTRRVRRRRHISTYTYLPCPLPWDSGSVGTQEDSLHFTSWPVRCRRTPPASSIPTSPCHSPYSLGQLPQPQPRSRRLRRPRRSRLSASPPASSSTWWIARRHNQEGVRGDAPVAVTAGPSSAPIVAAAPLLPRTRTTLYSS
jgi:hypothetical protein